MRLLRDVLKTAALVGSGLLLMGTPRTERLCRHADTSARFLVTGDCGRPSTARVFSSENSCEVFVDVEEGSAGLPVSGALGGPTDIRAGGWTLAGPVPTDDLTDADQGVPDGGQPSDDGGADASTGVRDRMIARKCDAQQNPDGGLVVTCVDHPCTASLSELP